MRKLFLFPGILVSLLIVTAAMGLDVQKEQGNMDKALKGGIKGGSYFQTVTWDTFSKSNVGMKTTFIIERCTNNYDCIPSLLGGFRNSDVKVRTAVYREISRLGYSKDGFKKNKNGTQYMKMMDVEIAKNERIEKDSNARQALGQVKGIFAVTVPEALKGRDVRALATMDPQTFIRTNVHAKMTYISTEMQGSKGMDVFNICLDAATMRGGNLQTQNYIANEMMQAVYVFQPQVKKGLASKVKQRLITVNDKNLRNSLNNLINRLEGTGKKPK